MSKQPLCLAPGKKIRLRDFDADYTGGIKNKKQAQAELDENIAALDDLGYRLYAENRRSLLLVLQGMDTSGKDGTIRHVMQGFNPQSCQVTSFKQPGVEELAHDFLWRISRAAPRKGFIGIFNRSHYEDVLVVRVHNLVPKEEWESRYERINRFEQMLHDGGTTIVKVFLHISKDEQRRRLQSRLDDPEEAMEVQPGRHRRSGGYWDDYQRAYEAAMTRCNTQHAPWYIVPANHKWYRNLVDQPHPAEDAGKDGPAVSAGRKGAGGAGGRVGACGIIRRTGSSVQLRVASVCQDTLAGRCRLTRYCRTAERRSRLTRRIAMKKNATANDRSGCIWAWTSAARRCRARWSASRARSSAARNAPRRATADRNGSWPPSKRAWTT